MENKFEQSELYGIVVVIGAIVSIIWAVVYFHNFDSEKLLVSKIEKLCDPDVIERVWDKNQNRFVTTCQKLSIACSEELAKYKKDCVVAVNDSKIYLSGPPAMRVYNTIVGKLNHPSKIDVSRSEFNETQLIKELEKI